MSYRKLLECRAPKLSFTQSVKSFGRVFVLRFNSTLGFGFDTFPYRTDDTFALIPAFLAGAIRYQTLRFIPLLVIGESLF